MGVLTRLKKAYISKYLVLLFYCHNRIGKAISLLSFILQRQSAYDSLRASGQLYFDLDINEQVLMPGSIDCNS
jgi:hypothetical protein